MSDDPQAQKSPDAIRAALAEIRSQRRLAHLPLLTVFALGWLFSAIRAGVPAFERTFWSKLSVALLGVGLVVALILIFAIQVINLRCPRCRKFFHAGRYRNDFARKCLNCGL